MCANENPESERESAHPEAPNGKNAPRSGDATTPSAAHHRTRRRRRVRPEFAYSAGTGRPATPTHHLAERGWWTFWVGVLVRTIGQTLRPYRALARVPARAVTGKRATRSRATKVSPGAARGIVRAPQWRTRRDLSSRCRRRTGGLIGQRTRHGGGAFRTSDAITLLEGRALKPG
jgi:hypothetical protein